MKLNSTGFTMSTIQPYRNGMQVINDKNAKFYCRTQRFINEKFTKAEILLLWLIGYQ